MNSKSALQTQVYIGHLDELGQDQELVFEGFTGKILNGIPHCNPVSNVGFAYRYTRYESFPRPGRLESNHCKRILVRLLKISLESALIFYSGTSHLFDFVNNYGSVHANQGFLRAWRKKNRAGGPILTSKVLWRVRLGENIESKLEQSGTRSWKEKFTRLVHRITGILGNLENDDSSTSSKLHCSRLFDFVTSTYFDSSYTSRKNKGYIDLYNAFAS
ncbi:hypothetical protein K435DRAFT_791155 [Dendrothele bispora CBS 962.96]|uniref:Uncharacterized protein n=1 Tax=Dendrothele bispora (strain CBS 962.96) TaxID=1314807 RepID=A0A4S8MPR4_DENBC|nr:hypothetical protein K435DRAFT_791155 [Dendrothele bispora CBS 962.96]